jgi:hypothetical protein
MQLESLCLICGFKAMKLEYFLWKCPACQHIAFVLHSKTFQWRFFFAVQKIHERDGVRAQHDTLKFLVRVHHI